MGEPLLILKTWSPEEVPVLDLRPEAAFLQNRLIGSYNIPLDELHRRMFCLPPPTSPLAVILPSAAQFRVVAMEEAVLQQGAGLQGMRSPDFMVDREEKLEGGLNTTRCGKSSSGLSSSKAVHLKGFGSVEEFLATRGGTAVKWFLEDSDQLWQAAQLLGLDEVVVLQATAALPKSSAASNASPHLPAEAADGVVMAGSSSLLTRLRRRFLFKPCPLLEQQVGAVERELAARRCSGSRCGSSEASSRSDVGDGGMADPLAAEGMGTPAPLRRRQWLRLRALEPGCGSGRNLAWLAAREVQVRLDDGSLVDVSWEVVGLDFWYGALIRVQELCEVAAFPPGQVVLHHCEVSEAGGAIVALPPPASTCKHHSVPRVYIQDLPQAVTSSSAGTTGGEGLPTHSFDLVLCVRFLHRAFNDHIPTLLTPGGFILYNTFLDMEGTRAFGRPSGEMHLLRPRELSSAWFGQAQGFRVVCDGAEVEEQFGRELTRFLACNEI